MAFSALVNPFLVDFYVAYVLARQNCVADIAAECPHFITLTGVVCVKFAESNESMLRLLAY